MNRRQMFKKAALSTLMLSAIASPLAANAAVVPALSDHYASTMTASTTKTTAALKLNTASAVQLSDPLKLAKQYAPETVEAWQQTLAKYDALIKSKMPVGVANAISMIAATKVDDSGAAYSISLSATAQPLNVGSVTAGGTVEAQAIQALPAGTIKLTANAVDGTATKELSSLTAADNVTVTLQASPAENAFFQSQLDLSKAASSKDATKIKAALSKLLESYQVQIEKLEQVK